MYRDLFAYILSFTRDGGRRRARGDRLPADRLREPSILLLREVRRAHHPESSARMSASPSRVISPRGDRPEGGRPWRRRFLKRAAGTSFPSAMLSEMARSRRRALSQPGARAQGARAAPGWCDCFRRRQLEGDLEGGGMPLPQPLNPLRVKTT